MLGSIVFGDVRPSFSLVVRLYMVIFSDTRGVAEVDGVEVHSLNRSNHFTKFYAC